MPTADMNGMLGKYQNDALDAKDIRGTDQTGDMNLWPIRRSIIGYV
jgi:hypothetical protein